MPDLALPWAYRPREFDDWGFIRDTTGDLAACARGDKGIRSHDGHRAAGTDPYGVHAAFIVKAVNCHEHLVMALQDLTNEVEGCWRAFDPAIRAAISNTNYTVIQEKMDKAKRVLGAVGNSLPSTSSLSEDH